MTTAPVMPKYLVLSPDQPADVMERELLAKWESEGLFRRTLSERSDGESFVFFEGPPTANGRPGIHHVFARTIKDLFCRYRVMKGYRVLRKAGWDTHGLPVEIEVEKQLGISGKQQIEALGVAEFNRRCRESVFTYREDWERLSARIGYWLDYEHPYITYSNEYVESVWWALKTLYQRDLLYRGHKILPYCPRCGTALSSHEVAQGYEDVEDPSVYIALDLASDPSRRILVWTTTPWTLVSNAALAVKPPLTYLELRRREREDKRTIILAEARVPAVLGADWQARWDQVRRLAGAELVGQRYKRPIDWLPYPADSEHEIIVGEDFVSAEDGTGVVHMSPAFGADDYAAGKRHNLAFLQPVGARGEFPADLPLVGGLFVKDADPLLIEELKRRGVLWKADHIRHAYPHCWRCGTPLLYYARTSWFVRTTAFRDSMLARNARVHWHPSAVGEGRFGDWLVNNIDWAISRDRYWGTPLPIWVCDASGDHVQAIGGYTDLFDHVKTEIPKDFDPHKPYIDAYTWKCREPGCSGTMRRVPEVIDTWFDSGSMPFAQWHFPFEKRAQFRAQFPADFIAEGVDQTRGWFYSLLAIATGLGEALPNNASASDPNGGPAPYRSVVVNELVLDANGQKMSKSRGNVVNPWGVIEKHGADAVRLFLVSTSHPWVPRNFDETALAEQSGRFLRTFKNIYSGIFAQYANFGWAPTPADPAVRDRRHIDRWVLGRVAQLERFVDERLADYDATTAVRAVMSFVDDDLANWYVRLNRARFYDVDTEDNRAAFATLYTTLVAVCRLLAPIAPFVTDLIHRELTGESVHLASLTSTGGAAVDAELDRAMAAVRELARLGRAVREDVGIKVRQPLDRMVCVAPEVSEKSLLPLIPLLQAELNVKRVELASSGDALVTLEAKPNFRSLGKRFGTRTPLAAKAVQSFDSERLRRFLAGEPLILEVEGESHQLVPEDVTIVRRSVGELAVQEDGGFFAAIDPTVTPELKLEGHARELISRVQRMRKESGFAVSDRIVLTLGGDSVVREVAQAHGDWIQSEVLAAELVLLGAGAIAGGIAVDLGGTTAHVAISRKG